MKDRRTTAPRHRKRPRRTGLSLLWKKGVRGDLKRTEQHQPAGVEETPQRPNWLKVRTAKGCDYAGVAKAIEKGSLHTVCQEAGCPNIFECFAAGTATFLILGNTCTRRCSFCRVGKGCPVQPDTTEPLRVAKAVAELELSHAVITSVTRDDLPDGGANEFANVVSEIKRHSPDCRVEVLVPDFKGDAAALGTVLEARPDILNHNIETVPRLYPTVRPQADYTRSLELLATAKESAPAIVTKSGIMVGLGERTEEVIAVLEDLRGVGCARVTIGQYLAPSPAHARVEKYYTPDEFASLKDAALSLGFERVDSGPLVRSSYRAKDG